ncbi:purine and uridine phosphorylase [Aspergillus novofumigatus IBT 16806]|uniref:Purine and uridine phosphorylase n=1 Tax=Aspergillus novofumigatus (strain IBT 16806) TaxID=1392255 RepID=A0A2I1BXN2_ASPN1|nr:purine and uridine phosphorylase [Aspergillus novofumigatus IBT 16806]PKX90126.1 purine and uridine phosphorylase [Aspergillus novofumigatus IBT 16806]
MTASLAHDDYTVAWICALSLEAAAAKAMLDEIHDPLPQPRTDYNTYTLGKINGHNVAIACLPCGVYGTTSAATVLAHMLPTFPSLRFGLMVGIGGGVPTGDTDIRLGDVVVCIPRDRSGGVIQYDYGKTLSGGRFQCTGSLNKPPQFLLTAVSDMRSNDFMRERPIGGIISETLQRHEEMTKQFSRPDKDWLFRSTYQHQSNSRDCSLCDCAQLVPRSPRASNEPHVHYGTIASGN